MNPIKFSEFQKFDTLQNVKDELFQADNKEYYDFYDQETLNEHISEEFETSRDMYDAWKRRFLTEFRKLPVENVSRAGHQKDVFIHRAVFSGKLNYHL